MHGVWKRERKVRFCGRSPFRYLCETFRKEDEDLILVTCAYEGSGTGVTLCQTFFVVQFSILFATKLLNYSLLQNCTKHRLQTNQILLSHSKIRTDTKQNPCNENRMNNND